jgi:hypothetical protein
MVVPGLNESTLQPAGFFVNPTGGFSSLPPIPEGFELVQPEGATAAQVQSDDDLPPGFRVIGTSGRLPPDFRSSELPPGFKIVQYGEREPIGRAESIVRGIGDQPIVGPLLTRAEAFKNALVEPMHSDEKDISHAQTLGQRYSENLEAENARTAQAYQQYPVSTTVGNLGTGLVGGAPVAGTKIGATVLGLVGKTLPRRLAAGAASGAGIAATDAELRGNDPVNAAEWGAGFGAAAPVAGRTIGAGLNKVADLQAARSPEFQEGIQRAAQQAINPTGIVPEAAKGPLVRDGELVTSAIKQAAKNGADSIKNMGARLTSESVSDAVAGIDKTLQHEQFRPEYQGEVFRILDNMSKRAANPDGVSFGDIWADRMALNDIRRGPPSRDRTAAGIAVHRLDGFLNNIQQSHIAAGDPMTAVRSLNEFNKNWSAAMQAETIEKAMLTAERSAQGRNDLPGATLNAFRKLANKIEDGRIQVAPDVKQAINRVLGGTYGLGLVGKLAPRGVLPIGVDMLGSLAAGHPAGLGMAAVGEAARRMQERIIRNRVAQVASAARAQAPAAQRFQQMRPSQAGVFGNLSSYAQPAVALPARAAAEKAYR